MTRAKLTGKALSDLRAAVYARAQGLCDYCGTGVTETDYHLHHRQLRSALGADSLGNCVALHPACHDWVHTHVRLALKWGFLVSRYCDAPEWVPVKLHGRADCFPGAAWRTRAELIEEATQPVAGECQCGCGEATFQIPESRGGGFTRYKRGHRRQEATDDSE